MTLTLALQSLGSRVARNSSVPGGVRRFANSGLTAFESQGTGLVSKLWNGFLKFGNSLIGNVLNQIGNVFSINFTSIYNWIRNKITFIMHFNWNITDEQLDNQIKSAEIALAGAKGGLIGGTLGWVVCGIVPGVGLAVLNEALGLAVLQEVGTEAAEEIAQYVVNYITASNQLREKKQFAEFFKNHRTLLRGAASNVANIMGNFGILNPEVVAKLNKNKNEPWSFATAIEETIDKIEDPKKKEFYEEMYEEFADSCSEAGYVVASTLDSIMFQQVSAGNLRNGPFKMVELVFNRNLPTITNP